MASKTTIRTKGTNGSARRKCQSWIESFVENTEGIEASVHFRRWAAIGTIAAVLQQRVWLTTSAPLYPNLYLFLVGHAGIGKSRTISVAGKFLRELPELSLGPNSVTMASLVDCLVEAKRNHITGPGENHEYHSVTILADELSAFLPLYDPELVGGLTTFYDCVPYAQHRRGKDIRIAINSPQLNILAGSTPSNLLKTVPDIAWEQGFMSRVIMIYSDERPLIDIFANQNAEMPQEMISDLQAIHRLFGQFKWEEAFSRAIHQWRGNGQPPQPSHPKLQHYSSRRLGHLLKLSMVSAVDRGDHLLLTAADYERAHRWLIEAESQMPEIFRTGQMNVDSHAMDEIANFIATTNGTGMSESRVVRFASKLVPNHSVMRILEVMEKAGMISAGMRDERTGLRTFRARGE